MAKVIVTAGPDDGGELFRRLREVNRERGDGFHIVLDDTSMWEAPVYSMEGWKNAMRRAEYERKKVGTRLDRRVE